MRFCSNCGKKLEDAKFCPNCGTKVEEIETPKIEPKKEKPINNNNLVNKKKTNKIGLITIVLLLIIIVCLLIAIINKKQEKVNDNSRTVMIYMVGSNLESQKGIASSDLSFIDYSKKDESTNVVLMAGGSKHWDNDYIDKDETSIFELKENGFEKVKKNKLQNMGDADVLSDFLNYVYDNYHTDKYDLIFWNHGGAVDGSEYDELFNEDNLSLKEMDEALSDSPFNDDNKLELIIFRTCLNGTIEVANTFVDYANYMVASEEVTYGSTYGSPLTFINEIEKQDTPTDIGKKMIDSYKKSVKDYCDVISTYTLDKSEYCSDITYSVINLQKIPALNNSVKDFFKEANDTLSSNYSKIAITRSNMTQYAGSDSPAYDMVDLLETVDKLQYLAPTRYNKIKKSIDDCIEYNWTNTDYSNGLSIYFPYNENVFLNNYKSISVADSYTKFITDFYKRKSNPIGNSFSTLSNTKGNGKKVNNNKADFSLKLTDDQTKNYAKAVYTVFLEREDGYFQPLFTGRNVTLDDNTLKASVKGRQLRVYDKSEKESGWLSLVEKETKDGYTLYSQVVLLEDFRDGKNIMDNATLTIRVDDEHPEGYIYNAVLNSENKKEDNSKKFTNQNLVNINDYDKIAFVTSKYKILDESGNYTTDWVSSGVIEGEELSIDDITLKKENFNDKNNYYAVFRIWDTSNNSYFSQLIKMD